MVERGALVEILSRLIAAWCSDQIAILFPISASHHNESIKYGAINDSRQGWGVHGALTESRDLQPTSAVVNRAVVQDRAFLQTFLSGGDLLDQLLHRPIHA